DNASVHCSLRVGVVIGTSGSLTPRGKLRARPCSGPSAPLYESRPASAKQPSKPDSFTGYVRQIGSTCVAATAVKRVQPARQINLHSRTSHVRHWDLTLHGGWPLAGALAEFRCHPVTPIRTKLETAWSVPPQSTVGLLKPGQAHLLRIGARFRSQAMLSRRAVVS